MTNSIVDPTASQLTRRNLVRGAAWAAPAVAMIANVSPAAAATKPCVPKITLDLTNSCKCPGNSSNENPWGYYVVLCLKIEDACGLNAQSIVRITSVVKDNGDPAFLNAPVSPCFPDKVGEAAFNVGGCTAPLRFAGSNSGNWLIVNFTVDGVAQTPSRIATNDISECRAVETSPGCIRCYDVLVPAP